MGLDNRRVKPPQKRLELRSVRDFPGSPVGMKASVEKSRSIRRIPDRKDTMMWRRLVCVWPAMKYREGRHSSDRVVGGRTGSHAESTSALSCQLENQRLEILWPLELAEATH